MANENTLQGKEAPEGYRWFKNPYDGKPELYPIEVIRSPAEVPVDLVDTPAPKKGKQPKLAIDAKAPKKAKGERKAKKAAPVANEAPTSLDAVLAEMAGLRTNFAGLENGHRTGKEGQTMVKRYRFLTLAHKKLAPEGTEAPPKLWAEV